jgi:hypothetical protein
MKQETQYKWLHMALCTGCMALFLTGCGSTTQEEAADTVTTAAEGSILYEKETEAVTYDVVEMTDFSQYLDLLDADVAGSPDVVSYTLYLEKVATTEGEDEIILAVTVEKEDHSYEKTIAAPYDFIDPYRTDGETTQSASVEWKFEDASGKHAYSAESIISCALSYANQTEASLQKYEKFTLITG